ncbi:hypothetical protein LQU92_05485 [Kocuria sp. LUK]|uniref:DUF6544 family protein n=1 Tax=Kocuria sp. LUK TaxID=2897828 RepID=UPI001E3C0BF3|nr:DUF6544 family protein [Kocuria sp. LUK]MCD1144696.1 hypothetical protein [Kocuria sp. LUK]
MDVFPRGRAAAVPRSVPRAARDRWAGLLPTTVPPPADRARLAALPEPARRWLEHAVPPGTPAWTTAEVVMTGRIRLGGRWRRFRARQLLAPGRGFVWAARTRVLGLPVTGFDAWGPEGGELRWRVLGLVPVVTGRGTDVDRSAAGRLAGESVTVPTACLGAVWSAGPDPDTAVLSWDLGGQREDCTLRVDPGGRLTELRMQRWGDPDGTGFARRAFGADFTGEVVAGGVRLPERLWAGWDRGTARQAGGEFFRARIEGVILR